MTIVSAAVVGVRRSQSIQRLTGIYQSLPRCIVLLGRTDETAAAKPATERRKVRRLPVSVWVCV